jgi:hypothetical protein
MNIAIPDNNTNEAIDKFVDAFLTNTQSNSIFQAQNDDIDIIFRVIFHCISHQRSDSRNHNKSQRILHIGTFHLISHLNLQLHS